MQPLWDFLVNNKNAIEIALKVLGFLGLTSIAGTIGWVIQRWWRLRLRYDVDVFDVITNPNSLLPKLYATEGDKGLFADHQIIYQQRDPKHDLKADLRTKLNRTRYLLITAPRGYGKTREAGELAKTMMQEDWRVIRIKTGWIDAPKKLPSELEDRRYKILIFLDDLNGLFRSKEDQSARTEQMLSLKEKPYHDRLLDVLDYFEKRCGENEVRVIATARSEADEWRVLNYDENDKLWRRFSRVELNEPTIESVVEILNRAVRDVGLKGSPEDFETIARRNDGSYRNLILNLKKNQASNSVLTKENFTDTQDGSWQEQYEGILVNRPAIFYIYTATDIARQANIDLFTFIIEPLAAIIWSGNIFQKFIRRRKIIETLRFITDQKKFLPKYGFELMPRDGQIEAKQNEVSWVTYLETLTNLLLDLSDNRSINKSIGGSLLSLSIACGHQRKKEHATRLIKKYLDLNSSDRDITALDNYRILIDDLELRDGGWLGNLGT